MKGGNLNNVLLQHEEIWMNCGALNTFYNLANAQLFIFTDNACAALVRKEATHDKTDL